MKKNSYYLLLISILSLIISCESPDHPNLTITDENIWLPKLVSLPAEISYDVKFNHVRDEFIPAFSYNKVPWEDTSLSSDALSWYLSPLRDDFTFRRNFYRDDLNIQRGKEIKVKIGRSYTIRCIIDKSSASYYVDGELYATVNYREGTVPEKGYFGFAVWHAAYIKVSNIKY